MVASSFDVEDLPPMLEFGGFLVAHGGPSVMRWA